LALPEILRQLRTRGYRIVQVVPGSGQSDVPVALNITPPTRVFAQAVADDAPTTAEAKPPTPAMSIAPTPGAVTESLQPAVAEPRDPIRPFTSAFKPARNMPTPGKFITTDPGGWPPVVSVPVPAAGGVGVSPKASGSQSADGRFLMR
jgi:hypothetical protein